MTRSTVTWSLLALSLAAFAGCSSDSSGSSGTPQKTGEDAGKTGTHDIGQSCPNGVSDCLPGLSCAGEDPHGQCIKLCSPGKDSDCGDTTKFACSTSEGHCYIKCTTTADCSRASEGYACVDDDPPRAVKFCDAAD